MIRNPPRENVSWNDISFQGSSRFLGFAAIRQSDDFANPVENRVRMMSVVISCTLLCVLYPTAHITRMVFQLSRSHCMFLCFIPPAPPPCLSVRLCRLRTSSLFSRISVAMCWTCCEANPERKPKSPARWTFNLDSGKPCFWDEL